VLCGARGARRCEEVAPATRRERRAIPEHRLVLPRERWGHAAPTAADGQRDARSCPANRRERDARIATGGAASEMATRVEAASISAPSAWLLLRNAEQQPADARFCQPKVVYADARPALPLRRLRALRADRLGCARAQKDPQASTHGRSHSFLSHRGADESMATKQGSQFGRAGPRPPPPRACGIAQ
jgi:hypothetical protein